jgi:hypothetical protein
VSLCQDGAVDEPIDELAEGPAKPAPAVRAELEAYLESDPSALGDVWRRTRDGETPLQIQDARGTTHPNFVWNFNRVARALLDGNLPTAPSVALACARKFRRILKTSELSYEARAVLSANLRELERRSGDIQAIAKEERAALKSTTEAEAAAPTGIYVYALPHYLRYPYDPESERTLLKVGHSERDVIQRFRAQTRTTALPEEPILLRVYECPDSSTATAERKIHQILEAADHSRSTARTGGTEWFLTSLRLLDVLATTLNLKTRIVNDPEFLD